MEDLSNYNRILIVGCPGSGKTTYGHSINSRLNLPMYSMDDLYWKANWQRPEDDEFVELLEQVVKRDRWIIEGNYYRFLDIRLERADLVLFIEKSTFKCIYRVLVRALKRNFFDRSSLPEKIRNGSSKNKLRFDPKFIGLILNFNRKTKPQMLDAILKAECNCINIK